MSQAWNRQMQNLNRLVNKYAKQITGPGTGFQLGETGPLRPTAISQRFAPTTTTGTNLVENLPVKSGLPARIEGVTYSEIPDIKQAIDYTGKQVGYKLPNGTITSNPELVNIANQQLAKSKDIATKRSMARQLIRDTRGLAKGAKAGGITSVISTPFAVLSHKDAYKYYDDMAKNESLPGEWRQIANALRLKEAMAMGIEGPGVAIGSGMGAIFGKGNKWATLAGGAVPELLGRATGGMADYLLQPAIDKYNFPVYNGGINRGKFNLGGADNNNSDGKKEDGTQPTNNNQVTGNGVTQQVKPTAQPLTQAITTEQTPEQQVQNAQIVNDYINKLQQINKPYIDALQNYYNNYNNLYNKAQMSARRLRDISAITGDPTWYQSAKDYNPLVAEANRLSTLKTLQDAQAGDINAINEVMGNLAVAQIEGLPPEAAFANKNLLTMMAAKDREANKYQIALENNLMKKYGIDRNYARALAVQQMRGQTALDVANINAAAYGYGGGYPGVAPGLTQQGTPQPLINQTNTQQNRLSDLDARLRRAEGR